MINDRIHWIRFCYLWTYVWQHGIQLAEIDSVITRLLRQPFFIVVLTGSIVQRSRGKINQKIGGCLHVVTCKFSFVNIENVLASPLNEREPLENYYLREGYTSLNRALKYCEGQFNRDIYLPLKLPNVAFTHQLARCTKRGI